MKNTLQEIEIMYGNSLRNWDGQIADMPSLQPVIEKNLHMK